MKRNNVTSTVEASRRRAGQIAAIHVLASKELGLDRATYEAILQRVAGVASAADLDGRGRQAVLNELRRLSGSTASRRAYDELPDAPINPRADLKPMLDKIGAILVQDGRSWAYAHGTAKRMFGADRIEWLSPDQLHRVVAAFIYDARRRSR